MDHMLTKTILTLLQLETLTQLMAIDGQMGGQLTDLDVRMLNEIGLSNETLLATMRHSFFEYMVVAVILERNTIGA